MTKHWWHWFKTRYPDISARGATPLDIRRARATQPEIIQHFFKLLKHLYDKYQFTRNQIYALDETGVAGDCKRSKAVGPKGANSRTQTIGEKWINAWEGQGHTC